MWKHCVNLKPAWANMLIALISASPVISTVGEACKVLGGSVEVERMSNLGMLGGGRDVVERSAFLGLASLEWIGCQQTEMARENVNAQIVSIQKGSQQRALCGAATVILSTAPRGGFPLSLPCYR